MNALDVLYGHRDNASDRKLGCKWERLFCALAAQYRKSFTPQQLGRSESAHCYLPTSTGTNLLLLPDVTIWTAPGEHHEIKHKCPADGAYGLELYRLKALWAFARETEQRVFYTIHDWKLAGAAHSRDAMPNVIGHWRTVLVDDLVAYIRANHLATVPFPTYVNGRMEHRPGYFWPTTLWGSLEDLWGRLPF